MQPDATFRVLRTAFGAGTTNVPSQRIAVLALTVEEPSVTSLGNCSAPSLATVEYPAPVFLRRSGAGMGAALRTNCPAPAPFTYRTVARQTSIATRASCSVLAVHLWGTYLSCLSGALMEPALGHQGAARPWRLHLYHPLALARRT